MKSIVIKPLGEVTAYMSKGIPPKYTENSSKDTITVINQKCNRNFSISLELSRFHDNTKKLVPTEKILKKFDVLINSTGTGTAGRVAQLFSVDRLMTFDGHMILLRPTKEIDPLYYGYSIKSHQANIELLAEGSTGQTEINRQRLSNEIMISFPSSIDEQKKIGLFLFNIDEKIRINRMINDNLEQQVMALYHQMFSGTDNPARKTLRADEYFDISIGKTPPRKEPQWFSDNPNGLVWVSISDMGSCGLYILNSSEYLTHEAVSTHNVKIVPDNTVILSFKLTIGRVAITDGDMTTNEAIAHFKTDNPAINEYLYCYLKDFNYQTMGSTSSIATAVNSKIIKAMPFIVPTDDELDNFHAIASTMFEQIKVRQHENTRLSELQDSLLLRLMSGELDISDIEF